jgi:hypothetical protein
MFISISAVPINPVSLLLWVLGSQGNVIFEIQFGLRVTLARLEFDHEVVLTANTVSVVRYSSSEGKIWVVTAL